MDEVQGQFGWMTLDVKDQRDDYPDARSEAGEMKIAVTGKMPALFAH